MKKLTIILMIVISSLLLTSTVVFAEDEPFAGTRTLVCLFDRSDLNNFIDGGSKSFETAINDADTKRYNLQMEKVDRDMRITLSFSFESRDEYESGMKELLGYNPVIVYQTEGDFIFAENFNSGEMLNFVQKKLLTNNMLKELKFDNLLNIENCTMSLNGQTYETKENFDIRNGNNIKFDELDIDTTCRNNGSFERTIKAKINKDNLSDDIVRSVNNNFKMAGSIENDNSNDYNLNMELLIKAENQYELIKDTLIATGLTVSTIETEIPADEYVTVDCIEQIGKKKALNEGSKYKYVCTYPSYYINLTAEPSEELKLEENQITYSGDEGKFEYSYQRGLKLSSLKITTDLSKITGSFKRIIQLAVPNDSADAFDARIVDALDNVKSNYKHADFSVYNDGDDRMYGVVYSTRDTEKLGEFTQAVLKGGNSSDYQVGLMPFKRNSISETISAGSIISNMVPISEMELTYKLPDKAKLISSGKEEYIFYDNEYTILSGGSTAVNIEFSALNTIVLIAILVVMLIIVIFIIIIILKIKKQINKLRKR